MIWSSHTCKIIRISLLWLNKVIINCDDKVASATFIFFCNKSEKPIGLLIKKTYICRFKTSILLLE